MLKAEFAGRLLMAAAAGALLAGSAAAQSRGGAVMRCFLALLLLLAQPALASPRVHALLVGVVNNEAEFQQRTGMAPLPGAGADVFGMARLLRDRGVPAADLMILTDAAPQHNLAVRGLPTLPAIRRELAALASRARAGDQVVILFSGHGYQQPELVKGSEADGLDEVFIPIDARLDPAWDGNRNALIPMQGMLVDDEIGRALDAIRARVADVLFIADFCHSGDSTRGRAGQQSRETVTLGLQSNGTARMGSYVGFFASPSAITAKQALVPAWDAERGATHGVLTGYLLMALRDPRVLIYRDLAVRTLKLIEEHNGRMPRRDQAPPPQFEGDLARPVLAAAGGSQDRSWVVKKPFIDAERVRIDRLTLSAGALDGVEEGAILTLGLRRGERTETILYGRAVEVGPTTATLVPASGPAPNGGRISEAAWQDLRDEAGQPLMVETAFEVRIAQRALPPPYRLALPAPASAASPIQREALAALGSRDWRASGIALANAADADLELRFEGDQLLFLSRRAPDGVGFGALDLAAFAADGQGSLAARLGNRLADAVSAAARFTRMREMALRLTGQAAGDAVAGDVDVRLWRWRPAQAAAPDRSCRPPRWRFGDPIPADSSPLNPLDGRASLAPCDVVLVELRNSGTRWLDVTPLVFAGSGAIYSLGGKTGPRLAPNGRMTAGYQLSETGAGPTLEDLMLVFAEVPMVPVLGKEDQPSGLPTDLGFLCQPRVVRPRSEVIPGCGDDVARDAAARVPAEAGALAALLELRGGEALRSGGAADVGRTEVRLFGWRSDPEAGDGG